MDNLALAETHPSVNDSAASFEHEELDSKLHVSDFFRDAVVMITGATGFVGKILVEKLLRSFDVKKIYLLVREKKNVKPSDRLQQLINDPIFDTIRSAYTNHESVFAKLEVVDVDFTVDDFLKEPYKSKLLRETQIVFNAMANVRLTNSLRTSMENNLNSVEKLFKFMRNAENIQSIVHVSTFYSNCDRPHIEEVVYDDIPFGGIDNLRRILERLTDAEVEALTPTVLRELPNSYVFSKKCAEVMIKQEFSDLPVGIFRPPIVQPSYQEPMAGWVDSVQAASGIALPVLEKRFLWYRGDPNAQVNMVPVDYCVAAIITAAADISARSSQGKDDKPDPALPIYNFYFDKERLTWQKFLSLMGSNLPPSLARMLNPLRVRITERYLPYRIALWLLYMMAYLSDFLQGVVKKRKNHVRTVSSLEVLIQASEYFMWRSWTAENDNIKRIRSLLSEADEKLLEFDVDRIDWKNYFKLYSEGLLRWLERKKSSL